jgi:hypothetical protein
MTPKQIANSLLWIIAIIVMCVVVNFGMTIIAAWGHQSPQQPQTYLVINI